MIPLYKAYVPDSAQVILADVFRGGYLADGEYVRQFEKALQDYIGNPNLVTAGDVSTAITLCLFMAGVRPGDEVIASPVACVAINQPVLNLFAHVVWCDVDPLTGNIDPACIADLVTPKTKAILYPHWAGDVAEIDAINEVAQTCGLQVVEDAGEALGAEYRGKKVGNTETDFTVFSFHAIRHITTGEGAAITFRRTDKAEQAQWLKRYGIHQPSFRDALGEINPASDIPVAGYNTYMTNIAGTIGVEQMKRLPDIVTRHRENGRFYDEALADAPGITVCHRPSHRRSAYWVYTFLAERRDDLLRALRERGVYASKVHLRNDIYTCFQTEHRSLPGVDEFSAKYLCIPCGWWVTDEDREHIATVVKNGW